MKFLPQKSSFQFSYMLPRLQFSVEYIVPPRVPVDTRNASHVSASLTKWRAAVTVAVAPSKDLSRAWSLADTWT
eukprot:2127044-Prymnesium_polylepis.1